MLKIKGRKCERKQSRERKIERKVEKWKLENPLLIFRHPGTSKHVFNVS